MSGMCEEAVEILEKGLSVTAFGRPTLVKPLLGPIPGCVWLTSCLLFPFLSSASFRLAVLSCGSVAPPQEWLGHPSLSGFTGPWR